jgi:adenosylcobinamide-GDP ribazoletransferase
MHQLRLMLVALQFYSRIPVRGGLADWMGWDASWLAPATRFLPLVGIVVAAMQAAFWWLLAFHTQLPPMVIVALVMVLGVWLTGAFHEDGFADACDGFGGQHSAEKTLSIMRDSRLGTYGVIGLCLLMLLKFSLLLQALDQLQFACVLICAASVSRAAVLVFIASLSYSPHEQNAKPLAKSIDGTSVLVGLFLGVAPLLAWVLAGLPWQRAATCLALTFLALWWWRRQVTRRLGGYTGDTLGAAQQIAEVSLLIGLIA